MAKKQERNEEEEEATADMAIMAKKLTAFKANKLRATYRVEHEIMHVCAGAGTGTEFASCRSLCLYPFVPFLFARSITPSVLLPLPSSAVAMAQTEIIQVQCKS